MQLDAVSTRCCNASRSCGQCSSQLLSSQVCPEVLAGSVCLAAVAQRQAGQRAASAFSGPVQGQRGGCMRAALSPI